MKFWKFLQSGLSEDNGNPSSRRINVFFASILFSIGVLIGYITVLLYYPLLIMEYTIALLTWMTAALGIGVIAKTKEQPVKPTELQELRKQEVALKNSDGVSQ